MMYVNFSGFTSTTNHVERYIVNLSKNKKLKLKTKTYFKVNKSLQLLFNEI